MANASQTFRGRATLEPATTQTIYNVAVPLAGTEVSQLLSDATKEFTIRVRGNANLQFSFVTGESATKFITVFRGSSYTKENVNLSAQTIYFQTDKASQTVEIEQWT